MSFMNNGIWGIFAIALVLLLIIGSAVTLIIKLLPVILIIACIYAIYKYFKNKKNITRKVNTNAKKENDTINTDSYIDDTDDINEAIDVEYKELK